MKRVKWVAQQKIAAFVSGLYGLDPLQAISRQFVQAMGVLIGCNSAWMAQNDRHTASQKLQAENVGPNLRPRLASTAWALRHEHLGIKHLRLYTTRTLTISDLLPFHQRKKTALFNEVYSWLGMQET
jgi:hypothetical protein